MSLEQALKENTETMKQLIAVMEAARSMGCQGSEKVVLVEQPAGTPPAKAEAKSAAKPEAAAVPPSGVALTYRDVQKAFLALVNKDHDTAVALVAELDVLTLKAFEKADQAKLAELLALIEEKSNAI